MRTPVPRSSIVRCPSAPLPLSLVPLAVASPRCCLALIALGRSFVLQSVTVARLQVQHAHRDPRSEEREACARRQEAAGFSFIRLRSMQPVDPIPLAQGLRLRSGPTEPRRAPYRDLLPHPHGAPKRRTKHGRFVEPSLDRDAERTDASSASPASGTTRTGQGDGIHQRGVDHEQNGSDAVHDAQPL